MKMIHLCIDLQGHEVSKGNLLSQNEMQRWKLLLHSIDIFIQKLDALGVETLSVAGSIEFINQPTIIALFHEIAAELIQRQPHTDFLIQPKSTQTVILKNQCSVATDGVIDYLRNRHFDTIILTGLWEGTPQKRGFCVSEAAQDFLRHDFRVIITQDGTNIAVKPNGKHGTNSVQRLKTNAKAGIETLSMQTILDLAAGIRPPSTAFTKIAAKQAKKQQMIRALHKKFPQISILQEFIKIAALVTATTATGTAVAAGLFCITQDPSLATRSIQAFLSHQDTEDIKNKQKKAKKQPTKSASSQPRLA